MPFVSNNSNATISATASTMIPSSDAHLDYKQVPMALINSDQKSKAGKKGGATTESRLDCVVSSYLK